MSRTISREEFEKRREQAVSLAPHAIAALTGGGVSIRLSCLDDAVAKLCVGVVDQIYAKSEETWGHLVPDKYGWFDHNPEAGCPVDPQEVDSVDIIFSDGKRLSSVSPDDYDWRVVSYDHCLTIKKWRLAVKGVKSAQES